MDLFGPSIPRLMEKRDINGLVKALNHPKFMIRAHAAYALGEINALDAVDPLIRAMNDNRVEVRNEAARSLGMLKSPLAVDALAKNLGYGYFFNPDLQAVTDANENIAHLSIGNTYNKFRDNVKWALIQIGEPSIGPMMRELQNPSPYIRANAAQVLGCLKSEMALDMIRPLLNDKRSFVQEAANWAIGNIG